jgi:ADP-heptose:LPS heptosyltransferase
MMTPKMRKVRTHNADMSIRDFYDKRNKILIIRDGGGVGDILMLRMMLQDFKDLMPEAEIVIATTPNYFTMIEDHPAVSKVVNSRELDENQYLISYNVTSACIRYETKIAPRADLHRSDIWAAHCGVELKNHDMHLKVSQDLKQFAVKLFASLGIQKRPLVAFSPSSSMLSKDLGAEQINAIVDGVRALGCEIFILNKTMIPGANCPQANSMSLSQWLACVEQSDYVITVDTGTFHAANGFQKPTVAIYGWADGNVYGKYHERMELVQRHRDHIPGWCGPCFNWNNCPKCPDNNKRKPCMTELTGEEICEALARLIQRYPAACTHQPF